MLSHAIVLGPQRRDPIVREAIEDLVSDQNSPVAVITAGWEEREDEDEELREHVGRPVVNLKVWARVESIFEQDKELREAVRERHVTWRRVQEIYRLRLQGLLGSTKELLRRGDGDELFAAQEQDSWELVRGLDAQHMARVENLHADFAERIKPAERETVQKERRELEKQLADVSCLLVAGGHVGVLLHRMQLFDVCSLWGDRPTIAWSAGAMALSERVVLFHDEPPQGSSYAEVMESGFGLLPDFVALPHARHRLKTDDSVRVRMLSRRFQPAHCALLDYRSRFDCINGKWTAHANSSQLSQQGLVEEGIAEESTQ
ncbi:MAG: hypothetical protein ACI89X_001364 [Planctomycetota bacterium]|jgi:hypothetical protein